MAFSNVWLFFPFLFCAVAEQWASKEICAPIELYSHSNRENHVLHSWELPEGGWCGGTSSFTRIYGWKVLPTFQEQTGPRSQREETEGLVCYFTWLWLRITRKVTKTLMLLSARPISQKMQKCKNEWAKTTRNYIVLMHCSGNGKPNFVINVLKVDFARRIFIT